MSMGNRFVQPANFLMLIYLTSQEQPLAWLLLPAGLTFIVLWIWFDHNKVLESELDYQFKRNPMMRDMAADIKEIKRQLNGH